MNVAVFVRPIHNPAFSVEPASVRGVEELPGYQPFPNSMDELALETALTLKERASFSVSLFACSVGGEASRKVLREFLACGAEQGICLEESQWEPDGAMVAGRIFEFFQKEPFDLGLFGARDLDTGAGEVGPMFAALAGIPYIDSVVDVRWSGDRQIEVTRKQKRLRERIRVNLPACMGIQRGTPLRYPSFWGRLEAESSRIRTIPPGDQQGSPRVEREKFSRAKPKKGSTATEYSQSRSVDRIRQAFGVVGKGAKQKDDSLIRGNPDEVAKKIIIILKKDKVLE